MKQYSTRRELRDKYDEAYYVARQIRNHFDLVIIMDKAGDYLRTSQLRDELDRVRRWDNKDVEHKFAVTSQSIGCLRYAGLVESVRDGKNIYHALNDRFYRVAHAIKAFVKEIENTSKDLQG